MRQMQKSKKSGLAERRIVAQKALDKKYGDDGEVWQDIDEHEKDVFDKDGYFDVLDNDAQIEQSDLDLLMKFQNKKQEDKGQNLADLIMSKMAAGDFENGDELNISKSVASDLDAKVVDAYKKLGVVLKTYRSGKLPKAFKVIPMVANWEELLFLTSPHKWSRHAVYEATKVFASNLNQKMAQRFYSLVLLPAVRENIAMYKKLAVQLYMAIKKSIFKTSAFFKGFLLPLAEDASAREAVIVGSILAKMSINNLDSAAAIMKLLEMPYQVGSGYFLKTMIAKRYALPTQVISALVRFFIKYESQTEEEFETMPVMWH